jgi:RNA polymerase sigma-70 factor (family 1)
LSNETELLIQVSRGNSLAFKQLYEYYSIVVYRVANKYLQSPTLAEDVVQEVFLVIWNRRAELGGIHSFQYYLFSMAKNLCLKFLRNIAIESLAHLEFSERTELGEIDNVELYQSLLQDVVQQLPPQQKQIFELAKFQGLSHDAIAQALNLSSSTVNNHMTAALKSIRFRLRHHVAGLLTLVMSFLQ